MGNIPQQKGFNSGMQIYHNILNKSIYFIVLTGGKGKPNKMYHRFMVKILSKEDRNFLSLMNDID